MLAPAGGASPTCTPSTPHEGQRPDAPIFRAAGAESRRQPRPQAVRPPRHSGGRSFGVACFGVAYLRGPVGSRREEIDRRRGLASRPGHHCTLFPSDRGGSLPRFTRSDLYSTEAGRAARARGGRSTRRRRRGPSDTQVPGILDAQVPLDAPRRRGAHRSGPGQRGRSARHAGRSLPAPDAHRRGAAVHQRDPRRNEHRRPAPRTSGAGRAARARHPLLRGTDARREARHHRPGAGDPRLYRQAAAGQRARSRSSRI